MSEESVEQRMDAYFAERANQPFGDTELVSGQTRSPFSKGKQAAADNLLAKADRALAAGDLERVRLLVDRAAALAYDEHEETDPAAQAASMLLFMFVTDTLEETPEGDSSWLDAAVAAITSHDGWGQSEMRHTLLAIRQDYDIDRRERRTIDQVTAAVPERAELPDTRLGASDLAAAVTSVLQVLHTYRSVLDTSR